MNVEGIFLKYTVPSMKRSRDSAPNNGPSTLTTGTQVRFVDLPAYPGLEGQLGEVVNIFDERDVDVRLRVNGVVKRVC